MPSVRAFPLIVALSLLSAACTDRTIPVLPKEAAPGGIALVAPASASQSQSLVCRADVKSMRVDCADDAPSLGSAHGDIIVGGQNLYVKLTSSNLSYNSVTGGAFTFDVTVKNLLPQTMGTNDGATSDGTGVNVFFQALPSATAGTGSITVSNPSGTNGAFTGSGQTYFNYPAALLGADGILSQGETSTSKNWQFNVPNTVTTFSFALYVSANVPNPNGYITVSPGSASVLESGTQALAATVKSAVGNTITGQTIAWSTNNSAVATVAADGTITAVAPGSTTITATSGARSGSTSVTVCPNLSLGGVSVITGPTAASFCLAGGSGNEYVVVPYNGDPVSTLGVNLTATGITAVSGAPTPDRAPSMNVGLDMFTPTRDFAFERSLRARERQLSALVGATAHNLAAVRASRGMRPGGGISRIITSGVPTVGDVMTLNVNANNACAAADNRPATVKAVTTHAIVLDENDNPANGLTQSDIDDIAATFDTLVYPLVTGTFGAPADVDANGRIVILYSRSVNELTPPASSSYVGGFVFARDIFPTASCATSNVGEMFYMLAVDSAGAVNGNVRSRALVKSTTIGTLAHEFQHLINASRRQYITPGAAGTSEDGWLNEGLSHITEELVYYHVSGFAPRSNLDLGTVAATSPLVTAFNNYENANYGRFKQHLIAPESDSPLQSDDDLGTRGSAWAFLRYAADRLGGTEANLWNALVRDATLSGTANLTAALGTSVTPWLRDFAASIYSDDLTGVSAIYSSPSWNYRSVYSGLGGFALAVVNPTSGVAYSPTLALGGGASYLRMGVPASTFAPVSITKAGGGALPSTFSAMVIRRK